VSNITQVSFSKTNACLRNNPPDQKKKIMILGPLPPTVGGITTFITGVLNSSHIRKKYELIPFGTERPTFKLFKEKSDYTLLLKIGPYYLMKSAIHTLSHLMIFPFSLLRRRPNVVHVCTASYWSFWENSLYILISKLFAKKTLFHIHGGGFERFYKKSNRLGKYLISRMLNLSDRIVVLSSTWKNVFENIVPKKKIIILNNFVTFSQYAGMRNEAKFPNSPITVLFVGGVGAKQKGFYDIIKAIPQVLKEYENIIFLFVACSKNAAISQNEELCSHTKFVGYLDGCDKIAAFVNSTIFILPSYAEGLPITMLEAMAAGLPIIATPVGAISEVISEGINGFLIEPGDYEALAKKILTLAQDEKLRQQMGDNNKEKIMNVYDESVVIKKLDNVYCQLF
jgi:glycosyltransferase involved in cell wall biosynthesis